MADFIDLMGFAKGQQQANKENWQDTIYDINTRNAEENLRQSQTRFDLALPSMQFGQEESYKAGLGNRAGQEFQTNVLTEAGKLPAGEREQFIADSAIRRLQSLDPASPGAAQERNSIESFLKVQASNLVRTNPQAAAALYGATTMGQSTADTLRQVAMLSDPKTAYDPINLATLANQMNGQYDQATNSVRFAGSNAVMPVDQFIGFARQRAMDQTADLTPGMQRAGNEAKLSAFADQTIEEFRKNGILAVKNPVTNQVIPLLNLQTGQQVSQAQGPQLNVTGLDQTFGMNVNPLTSPPPQYAQQPGVVPNGQAYTNVFPETASVRMAGGAPATPVGGTAFNPQVLSQITAQLESLQKTEPQYALPNGLYNPAYMQQYEQWRTQTGPQIQALQQLQRVQRLAAQNQENAPFMASEQALRANTLSQYPWLTKQR
jgi:hypothetical protein